MSSTVYDTILGGITLRQVVNSGFQPGGNVIAARSSGAVDPSELYGGPAEPVASIEVADLNGAIAGINVQTGLSVSTGITIPYRLSANQASHASGSVHQAIMASNGLVVPTSFSVDQGSNIALAQLAVHFRSTDGTDPVTTSSNNALAAQTFVAEFGLGPVKVNGTAITELTGFSVNPGIRVVSERYAGLPFPQALFIRERTPTIDIQFDDLAAATAFASTYQAMTSLTAFCRKYSDGNTFEADANLSHVKFSFAGGIIAVESIGASGEESGRAVVRLHGKSLTAVTGVAIV